MGREKKNFKIMWESDVSNYTDLIEKLSRRELVFIKEWGGKIL